MDAIVVMTPPPWLYCWSFLFVSAEILELFQDDDGAIAICELQWKTSDNCALRHRIAASVILHALTMFVADMFKSRCQLDAENLFLITNSTSLCGVTPSAARAERNHCLRFSPFYIR